jgi:hypothetical protein
LSRTHLIAGVLGAYRTEIEQYEAGATRELRTLYRLQRS